MSIVPTVEQADDIWTVLVEFAGASDAGREDFLISMELERSSSVEYRFIGLLGFGGKFRIGFDGRWYVDCYKEDETLTRREAIEHTNNALSALQRGES